MIKGVIIVFFYDSIFDDRIDDNYAVDFILDLYNNLKG